MALRARGTPRVAAEHGQFIYVYGHVRTKQIIYSLTRAIDNDAALRQLPYLGKQTVPAAIRKDFWRPMAIVSFPSGHQGLHAFRELREYRIRHEHEWTFEELGVKSRKQAGRKLRDQKANSVADLAAVLFRQEKIAEKWAEEDSVEREEQERTLREAEEEFARSKVEVRVLWRKVEDLSKKKAASSEFLYENEKALKETLEEFHRVKARKALLKRCLSKPLPYLALKGIPDERNGQPPPPKRGHLKSRYFKEKPKISMDGVRIEWADILDAEFAETWPPSVVHDEMMEGTPSTRHSAPVPRTLNEKRGIEHQSKGPNIAAKLDGVTAEETDMDENSTKAKTTPEEVPRSTAEPETQTRMQRLIERLRYGAR